MDKPGLRFLAISGNTTKAGREPNKKRLLQVLTGFWGAPGETVPHLVLVTGTFLLLILRV